MDTIQRLAEQASSSVEALAVHARTLEGSLIKCDQELIRAREEIRRMRRANQGNVVLVRRDGFSRAMMLEPTGPYPYPYCHTMGFREEPCPPVYLCRDFSEAHQAITFIYNGRRDEFGRFILEEA